MSMPVLQAPDAFLPHALFPDWLGEEEGDAILDYAEANQDLFRPSIMQRNGYHPGIRVSLFLTDLGPFAEPLRRRVEAQLPELCARIGVAPFRPAKIELELVAHGDGAYFLRHSDTLIGEGRPPLPRRVTLVSYLYRRPKAFAGGDLRYYSLGLKRHFDIQPDHRMMVCFPSFAPHSVERVSLPGGAFRDSRFAVDIWVQG